MKNNVKPYSVSVPVEVTLNIFVEATDAQIALEKALSADWRLSMSSVQGKQPEGVGSIVFDEVVVLSSKAQIMSTHIGTEQTRPWTVKYSLGNGR